MSSFSPFYTFIGKYETMQTSKNGIVHFQKSFTDEHKLRLVIQILTFMQSQNSDWSQCILQQLPYHAALGVFLDKRLRTHLNSIALGFDLTENSESENKESCHPF